MNEILDMDIQLNTVFFKVSSIKVRKWNVVFAYNIMKMMVPHDCHALLKERTIVTEATSLVITLTVHPCCNVMSKLEQMQKTMIRAMSCSCGERKK